MANSDPPRHPNWFVIRRIALIGVSVGLIGVALLLVGSKQLGAWFIVLGVAGVLLLPWLGLILAGARDQRRYRPSRDTAIRNSDFGFVAGLWDEACRLQGRRERAVPDENRDAVPPS
jgi:hypothetical protein